jgi:hypothetical protein
MLRVDIDAYINTLLRDNKSYLEDISKLLGDGRRW